MNITQDNRNIESCISPQILDNFESNEKVLFNTKTQKRQRFTRFNLVLNIIVLIMAVYLIIMLIDTIDEDGFLSLISPGIIVIVLIGVGFMLVSTVIMKKMETYEMVLSNKNLYVKSQIIRIQNLVKIDYKRIIGVTVKSKNKSYEDMGNLIIFVDEELGISKNMITIPNLFNLSQIKNRVESLLWHYGNCQRIKLDYPLKFELFSTENLAVEKKFLNYRLLTIIGIIFLICGIISFSISLSENISIFILIPILLLATGISTSFTFAYVSTIFKKLLPTEGIKIVVYEDKIIFYCGEQQFLYYYSDQLNFSIFSKTVRLFNGEGGLLNLGIIKIKFNINGELVQMKYGPITNYLNCLNQIYIGYLKWKSDNNKLHREEENATSYGQTVSKKSFEKGTKEEKEEFRLVLNPIDNIPNELQSVKQYLKDNEEIFVVYQPIVSLKFEKIQFILIGISLPVTIILSIVMFSGSWYLTSVWLISFVLTLFLCVFLLPTLALSKGKKIMKNTNYILTSQNLIIKHPNQLILVPFDNIAMVNRKEKKKSYHIEIFLKESLEETPFMAEDTVIIPYVPFSNDIFKKLMELIKNYKKN